MKRALVTAALLGTTAPAFAGGIGLMGTAGFHTQDVYYYDSSDDLRQYKQNQNIPTMGAGIEIMLGDKDDRFVGMFRGYWNAEAPITHPSKTSKAVDADHVVADVRDVWRHVGVGMVGIQWGFVGRPEAFQVTANVMIGSGFLDKYHEEYLAGEIGPGFTYRLGRQVQIAATVNAAIRYHKVAELGTTGYASVRWLFD